MPDSRLRQTLPIDAALPDILSRLSAAGAVIVNAEPGAGKTTRIPPGLLDAGLAELPNGKPGQIIVLQPRRVAARAAAARMSEEKGTPVGDEIGFQVRHESKVSQQTRIIVCTEGVFIRRLQDDPFLEGIAAVIFDEFHERSIDADLALALVKEIKQSARPDLKVVVMSATLDVSLVSGYLDDCPSVEVAGRSFGVEIEYLPFPAKSSMEQLACDAVEKLLSQTSGHVLLFLPGINEIRRTQAKLEDDGLGKDVAIMQLYGDLPLEEQQLVLRPSKQQKVVLATNVAETSVTIDGVTAVVDTGFARINRLDPQLGLNRLRLERISRASADQRSGRAGRTAPGKCLRLWTEAEQQMLPSFHAPEIARIELSECILQLIAWGQPDVQQFGWLEAPPAATVKGALELLEQLGALQNGLLTEMGAAMSKLPLQPRLARLLLEGRHLGHPKEAALCAALLAERDPIRRQDRKDMAARHQSNSDVLDRLEAVSDFVKSRHTRSLVGEVMAGPASNIVQAGKQFLRLIGSRDHLSDSAKAAANSQYAPDEALQRAILAAFPDRVCRRREPKSRRAVMVGGRGVRLSDESAVSEGELFVAVEFLEAKDQSELLVRQASRIELEWLPQLQITTSIDVSYDSEKEKVVAVKRTRFCDLVIDEAPVPIPKSVDPGKLLLDAIGGRIEPVALLDDESKQYLARVEGLRQWLPELELPDLSGDRWKELLPEWCAECSSLSELRSKSLIPAIQGRLTYEQITAIQREAPEAIRVPSGRDIKLEYQSGQSPVLAVRIQELFGLVETPRIARSRIPVLLHLLAPNYRIQQITPDLASFWRNTYPEVKKELKSRYPKHAWPDDPLKAQAEHRPKRRP